MTEEPKVGDKIVVSDSKKIDKSLPVSNTEETNEIDEKLLETEDIDVDYAPTKVEEDNIPEEEIGGVNTEVKPKVETNVVTEPREVPKEVPVPPKKKKVIKEYKKQSNEKLKESNVGLKLVSESTMVLFKVLFIILIVILLVGMIWGNAIKSKLLDKPTYPVIHNNIEIPNISVVDADVTENTYIINNQNNFTIINNCTLPDINIEINSS